MGEIKGAGELHTLQTPPVWVCTWGEEVSAELAKTMEMSPACLWRSDTEPDIPPWPVFPDRVLSLGDRQVLNVCVVEETNDGLKRAGLVLCRMSGWGRVTFKP